VQVERIPTPEALGELSRGVTIQGRKTLPCRAWLLDPQPAVNLIPSPGLKATLSPSDGERDWVRGVPRIPPRNPPIRFRKSVPDCWIGLELTEGKNRQVRRMTAVIGHPTLRLIRVRIGNFRLNNLDAGHWRVLSTTERAQVLA
jgi:23S rRNA pseudouridine2457 synthase